MYLGKKLISIVALTMALTACQSKVLKKENETLKNELEQKTVQLDQYLKGNIALNQDLSRILDEVAVVSGQTTLLRNNVENGSAKITQAEQIEAHIKSINKKLNDLEKKSSKLNETQNTIKQLKLIIKEQVNEIAALKQDIEKKDQKIRSQRDTIVDMDQTIIRQRDELKRTVAHQAELLYQAGADLEKIGDDMPEVTRKKNQIKVGAHTRTIYQCALHYYEQAYAGGYAPANQRIQQIKDKISKDEK